ncbi:MAG: type II toxin-antitoxin system Phd/YefM family antitoxin [Deltaproteobacteria bacterium]|nr:type II toxin-antitoxin system Phd/YefM family antitoxin [Deltaproteobacteria bacterium]
MEKQPMTQLINALSARTHFGEIMEKAEKHNARFLVSRRGKPKVVILSVNDFIKNIAKQPELLTSIQLDAKQAGLHKLDSSEIDAEIQAYRKSKK